MTDAFADCFLVATILIAVCLVLAWFLPRSKPARQVDPAAVMGA